MAKRRTRGDGGLTQRHDHPTCPPAVDGVRPEHRCQGRWQGTIDADEAGTRKRKYVYGRTMREAKDKLDKANAEKKAGTLVVTTTTVDKWLDQWLEKRKRTLKPQSYDSYANKAKLYIRPHLGRHRLTALRPDHIDAMYDAMRERGLAEGTLRTTHNILRKTLGDAVERGILGSNPANRVQPPSTKTKKRPALTAPQAKRVLDHAGDNARWWLALFYGMRQGECLGLRWCDVNWTLGYIRIQQTRQVQIGVGDVFGAPKSEAGERFVPLLPWVESRLRLHWINAGSPPVDVPCDDITGACEHGLVFNRGGKPLHRRLDNREWHQLLVDATRPPLAPIPDRPLHAARNSAASLMEAAGVPARLAAQILGHAQVQTTHSYQHADVEQMRAGLLGVGQILELD